MHNEKEREKRSGGAAHPERKHKASLHSLLLQPKQTLSVCGGTVSAQCGHGGWGGGTREQQQPEIVVLRFFNNFKGNFNL
jgi:hypothetical protein